MSLPITRGLGARPSLGSDARSEGHPLFGHHLVAPCLGAGFLRDPPGGGGRVPCVASSPRPPHAAGSSPGVLGHSLRWSQAPRAEGWPEPAVVPRSVGAVPLLLRLENVMSKQEEMG